MNALDIVIALLLLIGAWTGFRKGLVFEVAMIAGLLAGIYFGFKFSGLVFDFLQQFVPDNGYLMHIISFLVVFIAIVLVFVFFAKIIEAILKVTSLNIFNKIAGALFGVFKYVLVVSVLFWLIIPFQSSLDVIPKNVRNESVLYPYVLEASSWIHPAADDVKDVFKKNLSDGNLSL